MTAKIDWSKLSKTQIIKKLRERQYKFYNLLIQSDKFDASNIIKCYHDAGYPESYYSKYRAKNLYYSKKIQQLLTIHRENTVDKIENRNLSVLESTDQDLIFIIKKAKNQTPPDLSTMRAAVMDRAKLHGILIDKHQVLNPQAETQLDQNKRKAALKLAENQLLTQPPPENQDDSQDIIGPDDVIDADFEIESDTQDIVDTADHNNSE